MSFDLLLILSSVASDPVLGLSAKVGLQVRVVLIAMMTFVPSHFKSGLESCINKFL